MAVVARLPVEAMVPALAAVIVVAVEATVAVVDLAEAPAHPIRVSRAKILATAKAMVRAMAAVSHTADNDARKHHARHATNSSARTHVARVSTRAMISATTSTTANRPATCQQAFLHQGCQRAAVAAAEAVIAAAMAAVTAVALAAHVQVAVVAGEILVAGFGADRSAR